MTKNFDFQKIIRQIIINYCGNYETIAKELDPTITGNLSDRRIKDIILEKCLTNPDNYLKYKGIVEEILEDEGLPNLRMIKSQNI